jgi:hypothetical protein
MDIPSIAQNCGLIQHFEFDSNDVSQFEFDMQIIKKFATKIQLEVLREVIHLHAFITVTDGEFMTVIDVSDIENMISDIESGVSK